MKTYICVAFTVFVAAGYGGCVVDGDPELDKPDREASPLESEVEQSVVTTWLAGEFSDGAGFGGKSYLKQVGGDCPSGSVRFEYRVWKSDGTGNSDCRKGGWVSTSASTNCRILVDVTVGRLGNVRCSWSIDVDSFSGTLFTYQATNTLNALQFTTDHPITLNAGNRVTLGTCGIIGALADRDTYLRLIGPDGQTTVAQNDDSCGGLGSKLDYLVPTGGTYTIKAGCYSSSGCGGTVSWFVE